jgi:6-phosphogluconolactonase (cycloisomerase 2 family)
MAQSYVPRFAYMANHTEGTVSAYTVNDVTGQLRGSGYVVTQGARPTAVAVDPSGRIALVTQATSASSSSNVVSVYSVNSRTGVLVPSSTVSAGIDPSAIAIDPAGRYAFVANYTSNDVSAYALDGNSGTLRPVPCVGATCNNGNFRTGSNPRSVVIDPRGRMVLVACADRVSFLLVDQATGALHEVGVVAGADGPFDVAIHPAGTFVYVTHAASNTVSVHAIDVQDGTPHFLGNTPAGGAPSSVAVSVRGDYLYVANASGNSISIYAGDAGSGQLAWISDVAAGTSPQSLAVDPTGQFLYAMNVASHDVYSYAIATSTGGLKLISVMQSRCTGPVLGRPTLALTMSYPTASSLGFVYVVDNISDQISGYVINGLSGQLTSVGPEVDTQYLPQSMTLDPAGNFAYVANYGTSRVSAFSVNRSNGVLSSLNSISSVAKAGEISAGTGPVSIVAEPSGRFIYVANRVSGDVSAFSRDDMTGALQAILCSQGGCHGGNFAAGQEPAAMAMDATGRFAYVVNAGSNDISCYVLNPLTGELDLTATVSSAGLFPRAISVDASGRFAYVINGNSNSAAVFRIDGVTGGLNLVSAVPTAIQPVAEAMDPSGNFLYVVNYGSETVMTFRVDLGTGSLTPIGEVNAGSLPNSIVVDPSGRFAYVANFDVAALTSGAVSTYVIDAISGVLGPGTALVPAGFGASVIVAPGILQ